MIREVEFRYIIVRGGADFGQLYALPDSAPTIRMTASGEIKTSLSGEFWEPADIDWLSDEIRPEIRINGVWSPLGVFLPTTVSRTRENGVTTVRVEAYDRAWRIKNNMPDDTKYISSGESYLGQITNLLNDCGVRLISATTKDANLPTERSWPLGTSYLTIINELLQAINYNPLWFNSSGLAVLEPAEEVDVGNIAHEMDSSNIKSLLLPSITTEADIFNTPNRIICTCSTPDRSVLTARATNTNPDSPLSTVRRGRVIAKLVKVKDIFDSASLQAYANKLLRETMYTGETYTVETALFPGWGVYDAVHLRYGEVNSLCRETAWSMTLQVGGTMKHTLEKVVNNVIG